MPSEATVRPGRWTITKALAPGSPGQHDPVAGLKDEILEISDDGSRDTYTDADGNVRVDQEVVQLRSCAWKAGAGC